MTQEQTEKLSPYSLPSDAYDKYFTKPAEGRLLSDEEQIQAIINKYPNKEPAIHLDDGVMDTILEAQDAKTASILEPQCQARVERILNEIRWECGNKMGEYHSEWWGNLLSKEGVE